MSSIDQEIQDYFKRYGHYGYDPRRENIDRLRAVVVEATLDFDLLDFDPSKLPDTMDVESWYQIENQGMVGQCFPGGTLIRTWRGGMVPIERLHPMDFIVTAEGNCAQVMGVVASQYHGELVQVVAWGHKHLKCTPEHPVLTQRGYVAAKELTSDDWICFPRVVAACEEEIETEQFIERRRIQTSTRQSGSCQGRAVSTITIAPVPPRLRLTKGLGRIVGLFLAEGSTSKAKTSWSFCTDEEETLVADLVSLLRDELGLPAAIQVRGASHTIKVNVHGVEWAKLFEALFGGIQLNRCLPESMAAGSLAFLKEVFEGWMDGDGSTHKRGHRTGTTISKKLAHQMFWIGSALGHKVSMTTRQCPASHGVRERQPRWDISIPEKDSESYRCRMDEKHLWRKVVRVDSEPYSGFVFNLHVLGDESYVADGVGVHNCAGEARCGCQELAYYYQTKGDIIQLNRHYAYRTAQEHDGIRGDSGSTVEGNAIVAHEQGTPREELWPYQGRYTSIPSDLRPALKADALNYRIESWKILRSYDEVYAWLARRIGGVDIGIIWNSSCQTDSDGTMSNYRGWGGGGHSVALLDWTKKKLDRKGRAHIRLANSHTRRYGKNGWADVPPDTVTEWCKSHTVIGFSDMMNIRPREYDWAKGKHIV